jgi:hypothetical protein
MLGYPDVRRALDIRPRYITHVDESVFERLDDAWASGDYTREFATAWSNGVAFARSPRGLRGRPPGILEWKGHHRPASKSLETIPADLRVDHVYLISCKYGSRILHNASPSALFDHHLAPSGPGGARDWFDEVAREEFEEVWRPLFDRLGFAPSTRPSNASAAERALIGAALAEGPPLTTMPGYRAFVERVSHESAARWRTRLTTRRAASELYWRLVRMQAAPYFVLGARHNGSPLRYRIDTPWDFQRRFVVDAVKVRAGTRGQPSVDWHAEIREHATGLVRTVAGHV